MHIYPLQSTFWTFKKSISIVKIQKNKNKSSFNENYAYILKLGLMNSFEHFTFYFCRTMKRDFQISKRNKYSVGFVFATINLFLCCHENLLVPTHTVTTWNRNPTCLFCRKPSSNLRIFKPSDFKKQKTQRNYIWQVVHTI